MFDPVKVMSVETVSGASPPNSVTAMLYESATPVERVAVGNNCVSMPGCGPDIRLSTTVATIWAAKTRLAVGDASTHANSGYAITLQTIVTVKNSRDAPIRSATF